MEGTVIEWSKQVGDEVETDETLLEIATDKVDSEIPSPESGILVEILAEPDETVEVGQPIAIIETDVEEGKKAASEGGSAGSDEADAEAETESEEQKEEEKPAESAQKETELAAATDEAAGSDGRQEGEVEAETESGGEEPQRRGSDGRFFSPLVRSIAKEEGISQQELESIEGSGKEGRVTKEDVMNFIEQRGEKPKASAAAEEKKPAAEGAGLSRPGAGAGKAAKGISAGELNITQPSGDVEVIKMDRMRKMIAEHMIRSKQTSAHVTTFNEVDVTNLVRFREKNKKEFQERHDVKLTFTPLFIEAAVQAISEFPLINSSVEGDEIHIKKDVNFGMAVSLGEAGKGGLVVPVIKSAHEKNLVGLARSVTKLATKARNKNLNPDDLVGGTFSLTNYGSVGNLMGTPIINQPQVAIMGTGAIEKRPVVMETEHGDVIAIRHMMFLSLSYDHRIVDGAHGGAFLQRVKQLLENADPDRSV